VTSDGRRRPCRAGDRSAAGSHRTVARRVRCRGPRCGTSSEMARRLGTPTPGPAVAITVAGACSTLNRQVALALLGSRTRRLWRLAACWAREIRGCVHRSDLRWWHWRRLLRRAGRHRSSRLLRRPRRSARHLARQLRRPLGLEGEVTAEQSRAVLDGADPVPGEKLKPRRNHRVAAWDITVSPPKSISAPWAIAPDDARAQVRGAQAAAVDAAIGYLSRRPCPGPSRGRPDPVAIRRRAEDKVVLDQAHHAEREPDRHVRREMSVGRCPCWSLRGE
jgi:hypothetical protein